MNNKSSNGYFRLFAVFLIMISLISGVLQAVSASVEQEQGGSALVPGHSGDDYVFTGDYADGQVTITGSGVYHLTDNLNASQEDYGIGIQGPDVTLLGNGKNLTSSLVTERGVSIAEDGTGARISDFTDITGFRYGIHVNGDRAVISNNSVSYNNYGIFYHWGNYGVTIGNTVFLNENSGIYSFHSGGDYAVIQENEVYGNGRIGIFSGGNNARVVDNLAYDNGLYGIMTGGADVGGTDPGSQGRGYYANVTGNIVGHNVRYGIYSALPSARVQNNIALNEEVGIMMRSRLNCSASGNYIIGNNIGFQTAYSQYLNLTFSGNYLVWNEEYGIHITGDPPVGNGEIFNNFMANDENVMANGSFSNILWTNPAGPTPGRNIVNGRNIAGNYWSSPERDGWSDMQEPTKSGYSSIPYEVVPRSGVYDSAPLVWPGEEVSSSSDEWTIIHPHGNVTYPRGSDARYFTQAKPGAILETLKVDGDDVAPPDDGKYEFEDIIDDHSIATVGNAAPGQVHVSFSCSPKTGSAPLTVEFTDQTVGGPVSWFWQFGDGTVSTAQNPEHMYSNPGVYTVSLRAYNNQTGGYSVCNGCIEVTS